MQVFKRRWIPQIMPRAQSVHALVNAGFYYELNSSNIVENCRIVYGALSTNFTRAFKTEKYLRGKNLFVNETLQGAIEVLKNEMVIAHSLDEPPVPYRRMLALGLFYKVRLMIVSQGVTRQRKNTEKEEKEKEVSEAQHEAYNA